MSKPRRLTGLLVVSVSLFLAYVLSKNEKGAITDIAAPALSSSEARQTETSTSPESAYSAADLQSALADICSAEGTGPADLKRSQTEAPARLEDFNRLKARWSRTLAASASAEHLHLAALLADDPQTRFELLGSAISNNKSNPFLVWDAVRMCSEAGASTACPLQEWEQLLIAVDGQNSESWIRIAANRYAANEYDTALEAMRYASTAAESRAYWAETIEMTERGLAAASDLNFSARADMAFGIAGMAAPPYNDYIEMCKERSARSVDWAYACLAYGELVSRHGRTEMAVSIAHSIQRLALEQLGEFEKAAKVQDRLDARRYARLDQSDVSNATVERLMISNPSLFYAYLEAVRSEGEQTARRQTTVEIKRLFEQQPEMVCK